jgi:hypothetical protein
MLVDPRDGEIRYVGCSKNLRTRFLCHLSHARTGGKGPKAAWIRELLSLRLQPQIMPLLKTTSPRKERGLEETWIRRLSLAGCKLLTTGGRERLIADGVLRPDETRKHGKIVSFYSFYGFKRDAHPLQKPGRASEAKLMDRLGKQSVRLNDN